MCRIPWRLELQTVVSCLVGVGNWTWVFELNSEQQQVLLSYELSLKPLLDFFMVKRILIYLFRDSISYIPD